MSIVDFLTSSLLIPGDDTHAYRDPAVFYNEGIFHLYCTYVETEEPGEIYMYTVHLQSKDLLHWSNPIKLTPRDKSLNYSSPGNIVEVNGEYIMCLQTYPRENGEKYGNENARVYTMKSRDLLHWSDPQIIPVKGDIPVGEMGRMIDPYLIYDSTSGLWNCFYKQNGVSRSVSADLVHWEYCGCFPGGENVSVIRYGDSYRMFHSPHNGIGIKDSSDLEHWHDTGELLTFGQSDWIWAKGRLTAGFILPYDEDGRTIYLMFFHGTGPQDEQVCFDIRAGIGLAWSYDLVHWNWK